MLSYPSPLVLDVDDVGSSGLDDDLGSALLAGNRDEETYRLATMSRTIGGGVIGGPFHKDSLAGPSRLSLQPPPPPSLAPLPPPEPIFRSLSLTAAPSTPCESAESCENQALALWDAVFEAAAACPAQAEAVLSSAPLEARQTLDCVIRRKGGLPAHALCALSFKTVTHADCLAVAAATPGQMHACSVCLDDCARQGTCLVSLKCGHVFHAACMKVAFKFTSRCPNCRGDVVDPALVTPPSLVAPWDMPSPAAAFNLDPSSSLFMPSMPVGTAAFGHQVPSEHMLMPQSFDSVPPMTLSLEPSPSIAPLPSDDDMWD